MPFTPKFVDLVRNLTSVTGTGPVTLGQAVNGYTSLTDAVSTGEQFYYCIQGVDKPQEREVGRGTMQADGKVARQPISGAATSFTGGTKTIALVAAAEWFASQAQQGNEAVAGVADRATLAARQQGSALLEEPGREGLFVFDPSNLSAQVAADPNQGMHVPPTSAPDGSAGAWVRRHSGPVNVRWFGAVGDDATDDGPAFLAAIAYLKSIAVPGPYSSASPGLFVPFGKYFLGTHTLDISHTVIIEGEGNGEAGGNGTVLRWAAETTGIRIQAHNTSGAGTVDPSPHTSGASSIIKGLMLKGGYAGTEGEHHGIHLKARAVIRDCYVDNFAGDGIHGWASAGAGDATEGNINSFLIEKVWASRCRNGLFLKGADANAGNVIALSANQNRQWGAWDGSFLGNSYSACHLAGNGTSHGAAPYTVVEKDGRWFSVAPGQAAGASTNSPPSTASDNGWWTYVQPGGASASVPSWTSGISVREGGAYKTDNLNAANVFIGCYSESDQGCSQLVTPTLVLGGLHGAPIKGTAAHARGAQGYFKVDRLDAEGHSNFGGTQVDFGPTSGPASDTIVKLNCTNYGINYEFWSHLGGASSQDSYLASVRGNGFYINNAVKIVFRSAGNDIAAVSAAGLDLAPGKALSVGGTQVVASRQAAIADLAGGASLADTITKVNAVLAMARTHGLIAP